MCQKCHPITIDFSKPSKKEIEWRDTMRTNKRRELLSGGTVIIHGKEQTLDQLTVEFQSSRMTTLNWALNIYNNYLSFNRDGVAK